MKNLIPTAIPAAMILASLLSGCCAGSQIDDSPIVDPRAAHREKVDKMLAEYVKPEIRIATVYQEEYKDRPDYPEIVENAKKTFHEISLFQNAQKWNSFTVQYTEKGTKKQFSISADREKNRIDIMIMDTAAGKETFRAVAEIPEVLQMPGNIPAEQEEAVSRELNMIFQFFMNPDLLPRAVSVKLQDNFNLASRQKQSEIQEFRIGDVFCCRVEVAMRELFGGSLVYLYPSVDGIHEIRRIDIPSLTLDPESDSSFSVTFPAYKTIESFPVPSIAVLNGKEYELTGFTVTRMPELKPAAEDEKKDDASAAAPAEKPAEEAVTAGEKAEKTTAASAEKKESGEETEKSSDSEDDDFEEE